MREIRLTNGKVTLIDDDKFDIINHHRWYHHTRGYACTKVGNETVLMHRLLLGLKKGDKQQVDHKNRNKLDNRMCNLRICTRGENRANSKKRCRTASRYRGVYKRSPRHWRAEISQDGKTTHLGYFATEEEAARAYDEAAIEIFGNFATLNFATLNEDKLTTRT